MKKLTLILFTAFYLVASSGMMVCAQHLKKAFSNAVHPNIITCNKKCCHSQILPKKESKKDSCNSDCCKNGHCSVKVKSEGFKDISLSFKFFPQIIFEKTWINSHLSFISRKAALLIPDYHSPPFLYQSPLYLQYHSFRI